ncbi:MAG: hypothetical protein V4710_15555 [Verrucomicrobiota bacterium]
MSVNPSDDYNARSRDYNKRYTNAYQDWVGSLNPGERRKLVLMGVEGASLDKQQANNNKTDPSGWNNEQIAPTEIVDPVSDILCDKFGITVEQARGITLFFAAMAEKETQRRESLQLSRVIGGFLKPGNLRVRAYALAFAADLAALNGIGTQTEGAKACGCTRSNMSKETTWWSDCLELPPSSHQKTRAERQVLSKAQKSNHWRNKKCKN